MALSHMIEMSHFARSQCNLYVATPLLKTIFKQNPSENTLADKTRQALQEFFEWGFSLGTCFNVAKAWLYCTETDVFPNMHAFAWTPINNVLMLPIIGICTLKVKGGVKLSFQAIRERDERQLQTGMY